VRYGCRCIGLEFNVTLEKLLKTALEKSWFLYMIECEDGSIYTGISVDVASRYASHQNGTGARYTRSHPPKKLLVTVEFADRSSASKAEHAVKQLTVADKRIYIKLHHNAS